MDQKPMTPHDAPDQHGMFMLGTRTLFLCHMPMFTMENHSYQVVLKASLSAARMAEYRRLKAENPTAVFNLINKEDDKYILPSLAAGTRTVFRAEVYQGYSDEGEGGPTDKLWDDVWVRVDRVVIFRQFNPSQDYPDPLGYYLFGSDKEAHMTHFIARDPDFQHLLTLPEVPDWLEKDQLAAGVTVNFPGLSATPTPCSQPLTEDAYQVNFSGRADAVWPVSVGADATVWFSTGNLLNAVDPCAKG